MNGGQDAIPGYLTYIKCSEYTTQLSVDEADARGGEKEGHAITL